MKIKRNIISALILAGSVVSSSPALAEWCWSSQTSRLVAWCGFETKTECQADAPDGIGCFES